MRAPSATKISKSLGISYGTAKVISMLICEEIGPELFVERKTGEKQDRIMEAIDILLENHGVEALRKPRMKIRGYGDIRYLYSNTGDSYKDTIMYDTLNNCFTVMNVATLAEKGLVE